MPATVGYVSLKKYGMEQITDKNLCNALLALRVFCWSCV